MFNDLTLAELPQKAHTLYVGCRDLPRATAVLTSDEYGYKPGDFEEGLDLVEDVESAAGDQEKETGEQILATATSTQKLADLERIYVRHRKLGRAKHPRGSAAYRALGLAGNVPETQAGLFSAADTFYRAIDTDPTLSAGVRGLNPAAIAAGRAALDTARRAITAQSQEKGEADGASDAYQQAVARLRADAAELEKVCDVAFADDPDLLAQLGLR